MSEADKKLVPYPPRDLNQEGYGIARPNSKLSAKKRRAIELMFTDLATTTSEKKMFTDIAHALGIKPQTVQYWFKCDLGVIEEFKRRQAAWEATFADQPMASRKRRVAILQEEYDKIPDTKMDLKLRILRMIREEVGHDRQQIEHRHQVVGVNAPPKADNFEEWLAQNKVEQAAEEAP